MPVNGKGAEGQRHKGEEKVQKIFSHRAHGEHRDFLVKN